METKRIVPLFCTTKTAESKAFYTEHLGFRVRFEKDGYVGLHAGGDDGPELAFMPPGPSAPAHGAGLFYCLEVDDVDREHDRLRAEGVGILHPPEDKPWGDRALVIRDPNGISVYLHHPIRPTVEFQEAMR